MRNPATVHEDAIWPYASTLLPSDLETSARQHAALRRCRGVASAEALARMLLAYAVTDLSLKSVAAWGKAMGLSEMTPTAFFFRVRDSEAWLSALLGQVLSSEVAPPKRRFRLRAVDATVITGPGAKGTEWRAHVLADPATGRLCAVNLSDEHGGESYSRHPLQEGDVVLGDRGYAHARGIAAAIRQKAAVVVRINPQTLRLCTADHSLIRLSTQGRVVRETGVHEWQLVLPIPPEKRTKSKKSWALNRAVEWIPVRVVAARTRNRKIIWVLTTLPGGIASDLEVMDLYRFRWQIELLFKRLKSLLDIGALPSRQGPTARSWILARFLAAALAQKLLPADGPLSPWGYVLR